MFTASIAGAVLLFTAWWFSVPEELCEPVSLPKKEGLPTSFAMKEDTPIDQTFIRLKKLSMTLEVPDLRQLLLYCGSSQRPDSKDRIFLQFAFRTTMQPISIAQGEKIYLRSDAKSRIAFSEGNSPTSLWFIAKKVGNEAIIELFLSDQNGTIITTPLQAHNFSLPEVALPTTQRVVYWNTPDGTALGTLFRSTPATWYGRDLFLQEYGGEQFAHAKDRERIEFTDGSESYSCYVGVGDCLALIDGRWTEVVPGEESLKHALLQVRTCDAQSLLFDFWDEDGKNRASITLQKSPTPPFSDADLKMRIVGAKARKKWITEINNKRELIREDDWLLFVDSKWQKLATIDALDAYVMGQNRGNLLVFEGIQKIEGKSFLVGKLFNEMRNQYISISIPSCKSLEIEKISNVRNEENDQEDYDPPEGNPYNAGYEDDAV